MKLGLGMIALGVCVVAQAATPVIVTIAMVPRLTIHPRSAKYKRAFPKAISYVQPSTFDMLAGASPASARDGWAQ